MLKLYKSVKGRLKYWEAWERDGKIVVHVGWLGHWGKTEKAAIEKGETWRRAISRLAAPMVAVGYAPIAKEDHKRLVIQKLLETWGTAGDLDTRDAIEAVANEWLGWTGNGHSDGGDIGSGTINVFCFVVDPKLAVKTLELELRKAKLIEDVTIAYSRSDATAPMTVGYPSGRRRFSILGGPRAAAAAKRSTPVVKAKRKAKKRA